MTRRRLGRSQKVWISVGATAAGTAALIGAALWVESARETDTTDPTAAVTRRLAHVIPDGAPKIRFTDVAAEVGVDFRHGAGARSRALPEDTGSGLAWGDYDGDGDPDLYVVNIPGPVGQALDQLSANALYRNDGGRFTDVAHAAGVADADGFGMGAVFADHDADGDLDLYVTNRGPNRLYRNRGDGTFEEVAEAAGVLSPGWSVGACFGDVDHDGDLDLYVTNYVDWKERRKAGKGGGPAEWDTVPVSLNPNAFAAQPNHLFLNRGDGTFEDAAERLWVDDPRGKGLAAVLCDLDDDGRMDLYVNNDVSPNVLFLGRDGAFEDVSALTGTADPRGSMGLSVCDVAGPDGLPDGLPDLFITHWVAQENALYRAMKSPTGRLLYQDMTRQMRLGEISTPRVGWGCGFVDLDLDGRVDLVVANGSTLERRDDPSRLVSEPLFLLWNDGARFVDMAPAAGPAAAALHDARGLAAADYDGDGDVDLAVNVNRGRLLLLRNDSERRGASLTVRLDGPPALCRGARVEVVAGGHSQFRWHGADVSYASMHHTDLVFGLGDAPRAEAIHVRWTDGEVTRSAETGPGLVVVRRP